MTESTKNETKGFPEQQKKAGPGEGIRSMRATWAFRALNFELYAKPSKNENILNNFMSLNFFNILDVVVMVIGLVSIASVFGYIGYMRATYDGLGYYSAIKEDGKEVFEKKKSKWER